MEKDIDMVVNFIDKGLKLAKAISDKTGPKLIDFKKAIENDNEIKCKVEALRNEVEEFSCQFTMPGYEDY